MKYFIKNKIITHIKFQIAIFFCIFLFTIRGNAQQEQKQVDSLKALLCLPTLTDNELFNIYGKLASAYQYTDTKQSLEYAQLGVQLAKKKNNPFLIAEYFYYTGNAFYYLNQTDSALFYYEQSLVWLNQAEKNGTENEKDVNDLQLKLFNSTGIINEIFGKYDLALNNFFKALAQAEKMNDQNETARLYCYLASTYFKMSNYRQAEEYYLKGEKLCHELNDSTCLADAYTGLSKIFIEKKDYSRALEYGEKIDSILSALPNVPEYQQMFASQQLTDVWLQIPDYGKAMEYARKTVEHAHKTGVSSYMATALYMLSSVYLKQKKYRESEETAFQALATDSTDMYTNSILYRKIAQANIWMGNSAKGIEYFTRTINANSAFSNKNFQSSLSEMEVKYETEKKELRITALEKEKKLMNILGAAVGAVLLLALALFFLLWRWTVQKKQVAEKQKQIAEQQVKQLEQEKRLIATQAVLDGETTERARLARDLHDSLGSMLTGIKLSLLDMKKDVKLEYADVQRFDKALEMLDQSVREMRRVAHHLMPDSLSRFGLKPAVSDFCNNFPTVSFAYYGDESRLDSKLEVMIYRSIYELINNALKHSGAGKILVQIIREPDRITFSVEDNGCGFDPAVTTQGMGLQNIRTRVAAYNGIFNIDSRPEEGTEVNVELKVES